VGLSPQVPALLRRSLPPLPAGRAAGGKGFLDHGRAGSEVAIEPDGSVYPCCLKTRAPLGSLAEEKLIDILDSVATLPAMRAINAGDPEGMGLADGWDRAAFRARAVATDGTGREIANMCLGCDRFFEEKLGAQLRALRQRRLDGARGASEPVS
jgi:hypothetical protein